MFGLEKYKDIFGEPGTGVHKYRVFDIAIVDVLATIIVVYGIYLLLQYFGYRVYYYTLLLCAFILGIVLHRIFGVRTTVDKMITKIVRYLTEN
jgi:hypothetical protein